MLANAINEQLVPSSSCNNVLSSFWRQSDLECFQRSLSILSNTFLALWSRKPIHPIPSPLELFDTSTTKHCKQTVLRRLRGVLLRFVITFFSRVSLSYSNDPMQISDSPFIRIPLVPVAWYYTNPALTRQIFACAANIPGLLDSSQLLAYDYDRCYLHTTSRP